MTLLVLARGAYKAYAEYNHKDYQINDDPDCCPE